MNIAIFTRVKYSFYWTNLVELLQNFGFCSLFLTFSSKNSPDSNKTIPNLIFQEKLLCNLINK